MRTLLFLSLWTIYPVFADKCETKVLSEDTSYCYESFGEPFETFWDPGSIKLPYRCVWKMTYTGVKTTKYKILTEDCDVVERTTTDSIRGSESASSSGRGSGTLRYNCELKATKKLSNSRKTAPRC